MLGSSRVTPNDTASAAIAAYGTAFGRSLGHRGSADDCLARSDAGGGGSTKGKFLLISLDPLAIPIVDGGKIKGKITITLKFHVLDPEVEANVRKLTPKLKDTLLNYMYRYGASSSARGVLKLNTIMDQFQGMTDKQFGKEKVKVLVHSVEHSRKTR